MGFFSFSYLRVWDSLGLDWDSQLQLFRIFETLSDALRSFTALRHSVGRFEILGTVSDSFQRSFFIHEILAGFFGVTRTFSQLLFRLRILSKCLTMLLPFLERFLAGANCFPTE